MNLTRNSILFLAKGNRNYGQFCSRPFSTFVLKELVHSLAEHFETPVNKPNNVNVNYLKIPKKSRGPHKTPWRATYGPTV